MTWAHECVVGRSCNFVFVAAGCWMIVGSLIGAVPIEDYIGGIGETIGETRPVSV